MKPHALASNALPPVSGEQKAIIEMVIASDPDSMTDTQRVRFLSMAAAYAGVPITAIEIQPLLRVNSSRIRLRMPMRAASKIFNGFKQHDPLLKEFLEDFELLQVDAPVPAVQTHPGIRTTDTSEKGLETLIIRHMTWMACPFRPQR
jgi:hypothetical protein